MYELASLSDVIRCQDGFPQFQTYLFSCLDPAGNRELLFPLIGQSKVPTLVAWAGLHDHLQGHGALALRAHSDPSGTPPCATKAAKQKSTPPASHSAWVLDAN